MDRGRLVALVYPVYMFISLVFLMGHHGLYFLYFRLINTVDSIQMLNINFPMTGFEPQTSGISSDRSTNWATTTALVHIFVIFCMYFHFSSNLLAFIFATCNFKSWFFHLFLSFHFLFLSIRCCILLLLSLCFCPFWPVWPAVKIKVAQLLQKLPKKRPQ